MRKTKRRKALWWKISKGRFVGNRLSKGLDIHTRALVRGLMESEVVSRAGSDRAVNEDPPARIAETPLPYEPLHEWLTWTVGGNELNH